MKTFRQLHETSELDAFLSTAHDNPEDRTTVLVLADWLDEHGFEAEAAICRLFPFEGLNWDNLAIPGWERPKGDVTPVWTGNVSVQNTRASIIAYRAGSQYEAWLLVLNTANRQLGWSHITQDQSGGGYRHKVDEVDMAAVPEEVRRNFTAFLQKLVARTQKVYKQHGGSTARRFRGSSSRQDVYYRGTFEWKGKLYRAFSARGQGDDQPFRLEPIDNGRTIFVNPNQRDLVRRTDVEAKDHE